MEALPNVFAGLAKIKSADRRERGSWLEAGDDGERSHWTWSNGSFNNLTGFVRPGGFEGESHRVVQIAGGSIGSRALA